MATEVQGALLVADKVRVTEPDIKSSGLGEYVGLSVVAFERVPFPLWVQTRLIKFEAVALLTV